MQHPWLKFPTAALAVALFAVLPMRAADAPLAGNWKLLNVSVGNEQVLALIQVTEKDGKIEAKSLAAPLLGGRVALDNFKADLQTIEFDIKARAGVYHFKLYPGKGTQPIRGTMTLNNQIGLAQLTKTDDRTVTAKDAKGTTAEGTLLADARALTDADKQQAALKDILDKHSDKPVAYPTCQLLLQSYVQEKADEKVLRDTAATLLKLGAIYGPEAEKNALMIICQALVRSEQPSPLAIEYARKAEQALRPDDPVAQALKIHKLLALTLRRNGKADELKEVEARIDRIEEPLDAVFEKNAIPFLPAEFKGRKGDSKRVAVVELFTGAYCPPCVAADVAFDAALKTYKPADVIFLQYHVHIPAPDRLTNPGAEIRRSYYDVNSTPSAFLDGVKAKPLGGTKANAQTGYKTLCREIDDALETDAAAALKLTVERKGDQIDLAAEVNDLKHPGAKVKLRFVLVEEVVRYAGGNGQRLHHQVVRAFPGGANGIALTKANSKQTASLDLAELTKSLENYLIDYNRAPHPFRDDDYPLRFKHLKVVALIQDDVSQEIWQAVQVDVPEAK